MLFINRRLLVGLLSVGITAATTAQAGNQLFEGSWTVKAMGNERTGGTGASAVYSAFGIPQGLLCNPNQPRCPFDSTPTNGAGTGRFFPLGGTLAQSTPPFFCTPWNNPTLFPGGGGSVRPAKGDTAFVITPSGQNGLPIPPLYRNPLFFSSAGEPLRTACNGTSTGVFPDDLTRYGAAKGLVQAGQPVTGTWSAVTTGIPGKGGFNFAAAPNNAARGIRTTDQVGELPASNPFVYRYTYATLRNDAGVFGPGKGPGDFTIQYNVGPNPVATIKVKQGAAKFGGTMRMLGAYTTKLCYFHAQACSLGEIDWRYDAVGAAADTSGGVVTQGYLVYAGEVYYHTGIMQQSTISVRGSRFPWTTGSVTVKATRRGPRKTVHYAHGYDNRNSTGEGTIQLVSPLLTRWNTADAFVTYETGGIGILRIKFIPEPHPLLMLAAGVSLLGVGYRMRGR